MATKTTIPPTKRIIRLPEVVERCGLSRSSVYNLMAADRFPRSIKLSERAVGWRESDIDNWLVGRQRVA
ncbi:phage transcriptional regulator, AlpA [Thiorhodococcus drewsii AZ1]|uniref:Phage transcriptional regulator, AlpA n=1 Tax=Thiorhodococcus drewsii AZ1 TaxID=765913 RepID=G2E741_9GAMM|nr:AlpA family transcriptional regulator [Thiorhodococcus drewsii]EGV28072.1 phage transcriptional regulator, AlpA [Thiorhodococcus drewsii AZ1]